MDALLMAVWRRKPDKGLIHHSDRGSQYCSEDLQSLLKQYGMSCKGNCWDNVVLERFYRSLKSEQVYYADYQTPDDARKDIVIISKCSANAATGSITLFDAYTFIRPLHFT